MKNSLRKTITTVVLATAFLTHGLPFNLTPPKAEAATFTIQTGYYVGDGTDDRSITGIGFAPNLVMLKDDTSAGVDGILWKSTAMTGEITAKLGESDVDLTADAIQSLDSNGFTIGTNLDVNSLHVVYYWVAFGGSDCSSSGTFCVGSYTGTSGIQNITSVGFQPDLVVVKRSLNSQAVWKVTGMATNISNYFGATINATGSRILDLTGTGFDVGGSSEVNGNTENYWFFAFKEVSGAMDIGSYTGNATDNRNIDSSVDSGLTFQPNFVFIKNGATTFSAVFNTTETYGDRSFFSTDSPSAENHIQELRSAGGFQVGSSGNANGNGNTLWYAAFGGAPAHAASGSYTMANGSYTGNGSARSITGLAFKPDLVIIKHIDQATDQYAVFRTKDMKADTTVQFASTAVISGAITSLNSDGFSLGTNAHVNTSGDTYYWTAFGNAWDYDDFSGAANFMVGTYVGNGIDDRNITRHPFAPDFVTIKRNGTNTGAWATSALASETTLFFTAAAAGNNRIQSLTSDGFQVGTDTIGGALNGLYWYFTFKSDSNFITNIYTGNGGTQNITSVGFQPDLVWIKKVTGGTARGPVLRTSAQTGDGAQPFLNSPSVTGRITGILSNGFSLGNGVEVNENTFTYAYAAWRFPVEDEGVLSVDIVDSGGTPVDTPSLGFTEVDTVFECQESTASFGVTEQKIRVTNETTNPAWTLTIAADGGITSTWDNGVISHYDFNDTGGTPSGCSDGGDADSFAGRMSFSFGSATITPQGGCSSAGISFGSAGGFTQGSQDSVTLVTASGSADTNCYWDITGITVTQTIPGDQLSGNYSIPMTLSAVSD